MLELEEARRRILETLNPLAPELVPLHSALGRVCAEALAAPLDLPPFDNSAMDGYAVRAAEVAQARPESPVRLRLTGQMAAGVASGQIVDTGTCVRVFTGSPLPQGADAVVMQEDTDVESGAAGQVLFLDGAKAWENVRLQGEDVKRGGLLTQPAQRLSAGCLGLLAAMGFKAVRVGRRPLVALLATGSELIEPGQPLTAGKIYESNRLTLASLLGGAGVQAGLRPLVSDTLEATAHALDQAFAQADVVVTSGGVSVGELDFVKSAFERLGGVLDLWRVAIKPGKPFVFGRWRNKYLFGLPGNPVSAVVTFVLLVRPALWRLQGAGDVLPETRMGLLGEPLVNSGDRRHFIRVHVDAQGRTRSTGPQASHLLGSLAAANGLVEVPPQAALAAGALVPVIPLEP